MSDNSKINGYGSRNEKWAKEAEIVDIYDNAEEEFVPTMDDIVPVDLSDENYPINKHLYRLDASFHDIKAAVWNELWEHTETILKFNQGYHQQTNRFMIVYPSGDNHRVKNVHPARYVAVKNYKDEIFGHGLTTMLHPPTGTWMYLHEEKEIDPNIAILIKRITDEVVPTHTDKSYKVECALSFKGKNCLLQRHCDHDDDNEYFRYHCVLQTHHTNYMVTGNTPEDDYIVVPNVGEIWGLNVSQPHWAGNDSDDDEQQSWHLIIDVIEEDRLQK